MDKLKIIAVDFDGCLCKNSWPEIGAANDFVISALKSEQKLGAKLILWTCREGDLLKEAVEWCTERGLKFDAVNDNLPELVKEFGGSNPRKITATEYWDDRGVNPFGGKLFLRYRADALEIANSLMQDGTFEIEISPSFKTPAVLKWRKVR